MSATNEMQTVEYWLKRAVDAEQGLTVLRLLARELVDASHTYDESGDAEARCHAALDALETALPQVESANEPR